MTSLSPLSLIWDMGIELDSTGQIKGATAPHCRDVADDANTANTCLFFLVFYAI